MSTNLPKTTEDREIDLSAISRGVSNAFESVGTFIFFCLQFFIRNIIVIGILFVVGIVLGSFLDRTTVYDNELIVSPNFQSADYLYGKIDLLNSKIKERDTVFLKKIGFPEPTRLLKISIVPINGIYNFIGISEYRLKTLELMAEDTEMETILNDKATSSNYAFHKISYLTAGKTTNDKTLKPLLNYLNRSDFYAKVQKQGVENLKIKIKQNDVLISQINGILDRLGSSQNAGGNTIYNGDSQLNDVINTKDQLVVEQGSNQIELLNVDKIIKEKSSFLNIKHDDISNGKHKLILPFILIGLFIFFYILVSFYKSQVRKQKTEIA